MPKRKRTRARTGLVRKKPILDEQEQYRHNHGLNSHDVTMRQCLQVQMTSADHASLKLTTNIANLLTLSTMVHQGRSQGIIQEAMLLRTMQQSTITPIEQYYFHQEALLCDVPDMIHEGQHDYGPPRNRKINVLSDYEALHWTIFTKPQLRCIHR